MSEEESAWRGPIATAAIVTTIIQFLAGTLVCKKFMNNGSTGETSGFQFVCGLLSCSLWFWYGWLKDDNTMMFTNIVGTVLMQIYCILYYLYAVRKKAFVYQFLAIVFSIVSTCYYTTIESDHDLSLRRMGYITCIVTIVFIAAPMTMVFQVIKSRSTEVLPFPMISTMLIVSVLWYLYGVIINDPFVKVPNAIGAILGVAQLSLFLIFPNSVPSPPYAKLSQALI